MGITDPSEEYFKDGLWGWVAPAWKKLVAEAAGQLHVYLAGQAADIEVTQTTPADLVAAAHGWDGAAWRKLPMLWGYSDRYLERQSMDAVAAGNRVVTFSTVPAGEVWVVTNMAASSTGAGPTYVVFDTYDGVDARELDSQAYPTASLAVVNRGVYILKEDDRLRCTFVACAGGENLRVYANGYKMAVAE